MYEQTRRGEREGGGGGENVPSTQFRASKSTLRLRNHGAKIVTDENAHNFSPEREREKQDQKLNISHTMPLIVKHDMLQAQLNS